MSTQQQNDSPSIDSYYNMLTQVKQVQGINYTIFIAVQNITFSFLVIMLDISAFKSQFQGDIVTPSDVAYEEAISRWAFNAKRRAKVVAFVKSEVDVRLALAYARANMLPIAVRGGGHSAGGSSSSEDGLVIDLSRYLNQVKVDPKGVAYVGGGALWEAVDKAAIAHGLASVAGTVNHVSCFPYLIPFMY